MLYSEWMEFIDGQSGSERLRSSRLVVVVGGVGGISGSLES